MCDSKKKMDKIVFIAFSIILSAGLAGADECCKAYTDASGVYHSEQYCSNYCCYQLFQYSCCDDELQHQAAVALGQVDDSCIDWVKTHVWVVVLCGIAGLAILITLATCCCCCCCGACGTCCGFCDRRNSGTVIVTAPPPQSNVLMMHNESRINTNYGYNQ